MLSVTLIITLQRNTLLALSAAFVVLALLLFGIDTRSGTDDVPEDAFSHG